VVFAPGAPGPRLDQVARRIRRCSRRRGRVGFSGFIASAPPATAELFDYEAADLSTQVGRISGVVHPHTPLTRCWWGVRVNNAPVPAGRGAHAHRSEVRRRVALDYSGCGTPHAGEPCRPSNWYPPRRPFVRPPSGGVTRLGYTKLRADATGSRWLPRSSGARAHHVALRRPPAAGRGRPARRPRPAASPSTAPGSSGPRRRPPACAGPCPG